jgi:hypothetical protein
VLVPVTGAPVFVAGAPMFVSVVIFILRGLVLETVRSSLDCF